jgi:hypothetical protein
MHAGGHGLVAAHALAVHPAQQQAHLGQAVNQAVQGDAVQRLSIVTG